MYRVQKPDKDCIALAKELQALGCVNFEFILDSAGKYRFIECDPRFAGGVVFSCVAGYDCVSNHVIAFHGEHSDES